MAALKCPNPSCPFLFDPTQVPPGAVLTCPRCTMRFTLGAPTAPSPGFVPPTTAPEPEEPPAKFAFLQSRGMIVVAVAALMTVAAALVAVFVMGRNNAPVGNAAEKTFHEINFAITVPDGWETDEAARMLAKANVIGLKKTDSSARLAVAHARFNDRNPQPGELFEGISERCKAMFTDLETTRGEGTWLGQPCLKVTFRGRGIANEGNFAGEALALGLHGGGYWLIAWSLESEYAGLSGEFAGIAKTSRLIDTKREWKPGSTGIATLEGEGYQLLDGDQWWVKQADPKNEDALADLLLKAKFKAKAKTDFPPEAWAVTYLLSGSGEPMTVLKAHVKDRYAKVFDIKTWKDVSDDPQGDAPNAAVPEKTTAARFHAESTSTTGSKLVVLAAMNTPKGIVGAEAYCPWSDRAKWEKRLIALVSSLQVK